MPMAACLALLGVCIFGANSCERTKCETVGGESGRGVRYDMVNGCRIEHKGRFVPVESWKNLENE